MKKIILPLLFFLVLVVPVAFSADVVCKDREQEVDCPRITVMLKHGKDLGLTDDQTNRLKMIRSNLRRSNADNIAELNITRPVLKDMSANPAPDLPVLRNAMKRASTAELQMNLLKVDAFSKAYALLNNEQKTRFGKLWTSSQKILSKQK